MGCRILERTSTPVVLVTKIMKTFQEEGQYSSLKCVEALKSIYKTCNRRWGPSGMTGKFHKTTTAGHAALIGYSSF